MSIYFADTSAFAKRYLPENGSAWVNSWIDRKARNTIIISAIGTVEFISLLARRQREGNISLTDFEQLRRDFLIHVASQYRVIPLTATVIKEARHFVAKHPLRALDALQLASALAAAKAVGQRSLFISADLKLLEAAKVEGFSTDDPNNHP